MQAVVVVQTGCKNSSMHACMQAGRLAVHYRCQKLACPTMYLSSLSTTSLGVMLISDRSACVTSIIE